MLPLSQLQTRRLVASHGASLRPWSHHHQQRPQLLYNLSLLLEPHLPPEFSFSSSWRPEGTWQASHPGFLQPSRVLGFAFVFDPPPLPLDENGPRESGAAPTPPTTIPTSKHGSMDHRFFYPTHGPGSVVVFVSVRLHLPVCVSPTSPAQSLYSLLSVRSCLYVR